MSKFPENNGEQKTYEFSDLFFPYQKNKINIQDKLIIHSADKNKLTKCPEQFSPLYIVTNIVEKGFLKKTTYVTITNISNIDEYN